MYLPAISEELLQSPKNQNIKISLFREDKFPVVFLFFDAGFKCGSLNPPAYFIHIIPHIFQPELKLHRFTK